MRNCNQCSRVKLLMSVFTVTFNESKYVCVHVGISTKCQNDIECVHMSESVCMRVFVLFDNYTILNSVQAYKSDIIELIIEPQCLAV